MAKGRESFERRQRERAKKAKADAKRERRFSKGDEDADGGEESSPSIDEDAILAELAALHEAFDDDAISFDDFEAKRSELLARLQVE